MLSIENEFLVRRVLVEKKPFFILVNSDMYCGWWYGGLKNVKFEARRGTKNDYGGRNYINHLKDGFFVITEDTIQKGCLVSYQHAKILK